MLYKGCNLHDYICFLVFKKSYLFILSVLHFPYTYESAPWSFLVLMKPEELVGFPGTKVKKSCEPQCGR